MKRDKKQFAICVRNEGAEDLEIRKVYQILPDARAAKDKYIRVIDESGEDYLYPADYFVPLELPREAERALSAATR
ncbi:MAG: hypothetical protein HYT78_03645 [Deltaproteobacteria bacterium]|nr:hypothetical protein [Deltaproteobacteria bacterium]